VAEQLPGHEGLGIGGEAIVRPAQSIGDQVARILQQFGCSQCRDDPEDKVMVEKASARPPRTSAKLCAPFSQRLA